MLHQRIKQGERGAAAVEFALILPVLLVLVMGLIEFSLLFNNQISLTNAAREGARFMAIKNNSANAKSVVIAAAPSINPRISASDISVSPSNCTAGSTVTVTIVYNARLLTGFFGTVLPLTGKGVMLCGG